MTAFHGHLLLGVSYDASGRPSKKNRRAVWEVMSDFGYGPIMVPKGTKTDLASVPRVAWSIFPPDGVWLEAAVIHDYLYATKGLNGVWSRKEADALFLEAMKDLGVNKTDRTLIHAAVRLGGGFAWGS